MCLRLPAEKDGVGAEREREREREMCVCVCVCLRVYARAQVHENVFAKREESGFCQYSGSVQPYKCCCTTGRERERERERAREREKWGEGGGGENKKLSQNTVFNRPQYWRFETITVDETT